MSYEQGTVNEPEGKKKYTLGAWASFWAGWIGGIVILYGYYLIQTGKVQSNNTKYIWLNIVGSGLILLNVLYHKAYPSVVVNFVWMIVGIWSLSKM